MPTTDNNPNLDRLPPQNLEAETALLGCLMLDRDAIVKVADQIISDDFYDYRHRLIYEAIMELFEKNVSIDVLTCANLLEEKKLMDKVGGAGYLTSLVNAVPSAAHATYYASIVRKKGTLRRLIQSASEITNMAFSEEGDIENILDDAEQKLFGISQKHLKQNFIPISNVLHETFERIDLLHKDKDQGRLRGLPTGFFDLDKKLGGLQKSDLVILAARPSMGKTSLALDILRYVAVHTKTPVGIFSLEMSKDQLVDRLLAAQTDIDLWKIRTGQLEDSDFERLQEGMGILADSPIYIDDAASGNVMEIRTKARRLQAENNLGLIIVDYLQLMAGRNQENRVQEVSEISRSLKILARELNVPVLALSQLSRGVESRPDKIPQLSDLRESGCLTGESLVTLANTGQQVPISQLVGKNNIKVWALNQQTLQIEPAQVTNAFSTGIKPVWKLTTKLGRQIRATGNHKFQTIRGWRRLDELQSGEHLALPRNIQTNSTATMTNSELALLGHLIGDGCTLPTHAIQYTTRELDLAEKVANLATELFGNKIKPRINREHAWYQVYLASTKKHTHNVHSAIMEWLSGLGVWGLRSYEKRIPTEVFKQPTDSIALFIRHLWSTDGCIQVYSTGHAPSVYYASSSRELARGVQSLLLRLGINARLSSQPQPGKGRDQHHVSVTGQPDLQKFVSLVGAVGSYKQAALSKLQGYLQNKIANTNRDIIPHDIWSTHIKPAIQDAGLTSRQFQANLNMAYCGTSLYQQNLSRHRLARVAEVVQSATLATLAQSDIYWDQIASIEPDGMEEVYDLTVERHHNFIANDIIVHNSIEQDADIVMFIYREDMYKSPDQPDTNVAKILIKKHRNGPTGDVDLTFEGTKTTFSNRTAQFDTTPEAVIQSLSADEEI
jgi:replicative DNA helicase